MALLALDHVNVKTSRLDEMVRWYEDVLGLKAGPRPDFGFPGAWLYLGEQPIVHLVGVAAEPKSVDPKIEHFAIRAEGLTEFLAHLDAKGIEATMIELADVGILQANIHDPDGNHIHIDFDVAERG